MAEMQDNFPDYSKYSITELYDILNRIEKDKYPEKVRAIDEQIKLKANFEYDNSYKLFNKTEVVYKSKFFVWSLIILSSCIFLFDIVGFLFYGNIITLIYLLIIGIVLALVLSNSKKQKLTIKIYSVLLIIPGSLKLLALLLLIIKYLASPSEENWRGLSLNGTLGDLLSFIMLITFSFGLYYLLTINKNVIIKNNQINKIA